MQNCDSLSLCTLLRSSLFLVLIADSGLYDSTKKNPRVARGRCTNQAHGKARRGNIAPGGAFPGRSLDGSKGFDSHGVWRESMRGVGGHLRSAVLCYAAVLQLLPFQRRGSRDSRLPHQQKEKRRRPGERLVTPQKKSRHLVTPFMRRAGRARDPLGRRPLSPGGC